MGGETFAPGEVVMTITTDDDGRASTGADALPYGSFTIRESKTNDTFLNTSDDMHVTISEDGKVYEFTAADEVVRGGVEITKRDIESDLSTPLGGAASFDGVTFEVTSLNDNPVVVGGLTYGKGDVVATLTIKDAMPRPPSACSPLATTPCRRPRAPRGTISTARCMSSPSPRTACS